MILIFIYSLKFQLLTLIAFVLLIEASAVFLIYTTITQIVYDDRLFIDEAKKALVLWFLFVASLTINQIDLVFPYYQSLVDIILTVNAVNDGITLSMISYIILTNLTIILIMCLFIIVTLLFIVVFKYIVNIRTANKRMNVGKAYLTIYKTRKLQKLLLQQILNNAITQRNKMKWVSYIKGPKRHVVQIKHTPKPSKWTNAAGTIIVNTYIKESIWKDIFAIYGPKIPNFKFTKWGIIGEAAFDMYGPFYVPLSPHEIIAKLDEEQQQIIYDYAYAHKINYDDDCKQLREENDRTKQEWIQKRFDYTACVGLVKSKLHNNPSIYLDYIDATEVK